MPNYNYRSNDYMRRGQYSRPAMTTPPRPEYECSVRVEKKAENCFPIAMSYVPWQEFKDLYPAEKALHRGTIFEELDKPFLGKRGCCK